MSKKLWFVLSLFVAASMILSACGAESPARDLTQLDEEATEIASAIGNEVQKALNETAATEAPESSEEATVTNVNLDDDAQLCASQCTWDIGVNEYTDGSTDQVGFAWGESVSWKGGDKKVSGSYNIVLLKPGWYEDLTIKNGGVYVYNFSEGADESSLEAVLNKLAADVFEGKPGDPPTLQDITVWDSPKASISNSAKGPEGVGEGLQYPQLDGQEMSCAPEQSPCDVDVEVGENQIGILFGYQIAYPPADLAGPEASGAAANEPENRCDLVALDMGQYDGLQITDGRIEIYNVPASDPNGWFKNLVAERAEEQHGNYGCPAWEEVKVWSPQGESGSYTLLWDSTGKDATATGPK